MQHNSNILHNMEYSSNMCSNIGIMLVLTYRMFKNFIFTICLTKVTLLYQSMTKYDQSITSFEGGLRGV